MFTISSQYIISAYLPSKKLYIRSEEEKATADNKFKCRGFVVIDTGSETM